MNCATYLVKALEREGVEVVFGYPGGAIMPFYDALLDAKFKHVLVRHEQAAALAADGFARATGKVGICLATSGPGATNLLTGLANAYLDSVPVVAITGQVPTTLMGTDAFQEVDMLGMSMSIVKHGFLLQKASDLPETIREAFHLARSGRPGPVLIDMPKDVSLAEISPTPQSTGPEPETHGSNHKARQKAASLLDASQKPIICAGGGIGIGQATPVFRDFVARTGIPVVTTLKGIGSLPADHELLLGMLGMHGTKAANLAVQESDLLIVVGARFDDRATGKLAAFAPAAKVIHMDIDPCEINKLRMCQIGLDGSLDKNLSALKRSLSIEPWRAYCQRLKNQTDWNYNAPGKGIYAPRLLKKLSERCNNQTIVSCDVGQHQMWVAQHFGFHEPNAHLSSGGLGAMGYGLPAAIGAQFGLPDHRVITVSGDGSIMMNIQELATINRYGLPIKILLFDNQHLGLVRQWQELFFDSRFSAVDLSDNPDFVELAKAFRVPGFRVERKDQEDQAIQDILETDGPLFVHAVIDPDENVWPLVPPNQANDQMMEAARP